MEPFKTYTEIEQVTEDGSIESDCYSIAFKIKPGSGAVVEIDSFSLSDGDPMLSISNDFPGMDITKYRVKFTTAGILYVIRQKITGPIGQSETC